MVAPISAAGAYANIAKLTSALGKSPAGAAAPENFGDLVKQALGAVNEAGQKSDVQARAMANGKADMVNVVTAVAETETAISAVVAVRDKVIAAYEEIMRMPI
ncbi:MAG: flagellar hook-basal body complex protein FliE [Solirubrobacterales bacterium]|nr:flagellar hook-basal body complex protein FliE [Solirubrobacterales bacterium]